MVLSLTLTIIFILINVNFNSYNEFTKFCDKALCGSYS